MIPPQAGSVVPTTILVPIDFSPSSHQALDAAAELAEKFHAKVYLLHVIAENLGYTLPEGVSQQTIIDASRKTAEHNFKLSLDALTAKGIPVMAHVDVADDVAGCILDTIERENADLLVITTHGQSGWYPQVFGSVAEKLVKLAHCPLLLLRTSKPASTAKVAYSGMMEWW